MKGILAVENFGAILCFITSLQTNLASFSDFKNASQLFLYLVMEGTDLGTLKFMTR